MCQLTFRKKINVMNNAVKIVPKTILNLQIKIKKKKSTLKKRKCGFRLSWLLEVKDQGTKADCGSCWPESVDWSEDQEKSLERSPMLGIEAFEVIQFQSQCQVPAKSLKQVRTYMFCLKKKVSIQLQLCWPWVNTDLVWPVFRSFKCSQTPTFFKKCS